ncbi:hypothetical protein CAPTEDRAFT_156688 [Capitella teleta]|uniref:DNA-directed RNA polymerase n=1 Tax=Capitella teleta TaxID=283909 RepID=R7VAU6_CAPTE|nr:hypothetical protein CAPTEDRAFT_156688 [Capitella teleta]|eukprot:ELU15709.1 hypothetical protein CAPTEDRAFT_156688 [Capitella teleta]
MPHPVLCMLFRTAKLKQVTFSPIELPSVIPPVPWTSHKHGADIFSTVELIRHADDVRRDTLLSTPLQKVLPTLDALNTVGACPWIINKKVLDVMVEVFKTGGSEQLDVPCSIHDIPLPPKIHSWCPAAVWHRLLLEGSIAVDFSSNVSKCRNVKQQKEKNSPVEKSLRSDVWTLLTSMSLKSTFPAVEVPGSDLSRGIMVFGQGKPLGASGLDWLKIHCINLTGLKKRSPNSERLAYANEVMDDILDSAERPLSGRGWWKDADEPWQTLATCMEIAAASQSPDPSAFVSHLPVHQDGSCNGLQHYAALGRDVEGAKSINLHPMDTPRDVYSDVVELVESVRADDAMKGNEIAKVLEGHIQRKVIKQTIMTTVYGVTIYGARKQIQGQLEDLETFPQEHVSAAKNYLTAKTLSSLEQMFTSARQIQDWFVLMAMLVTRVRGNLVSWRTPLGWPVVQYYASHNHTFSKLSGEKALLVKPKSRKQMNAFPPNFIHSLDASHMMLTAVHCQRKGITFASVHDCFWTHPCHIPVMNKICREQFVSLHNYPILEELSELMSEQHGFHINETGEVAELKKVFNYVLTRVPERGEFELENVLDSTYFFS